jgi:hypothetical protein
MIDALIASLAAVFVLAAAAAADDGAALERNPIERLAGSGQPAQQ